MIADTLAALALRETKCRYIVASVRGTIEDKSVQVAASEVCNEYKAIHRAYAQLLDSDPSQEALKRAVFIQWYSMCEPPIYGGINEVDLQVEIAVLTKLDQLLCADQADAELTCMLGYYSTWEWIFQRDEFQHLRVLQSFVEANMSVDSPLTAPPIRIAEMSTRGQMGYYWLTWGGGELLRQAVN